MHKKILIAFGITILFLGVGIQPAIATVEHENIDVDYYDVNVEFYGLGKNHTVQLTKEQMEELDLLFENIREQINNTNSIEDIIQIYNEAIVELDSFGLLGDCSVKQVQELVTGRFHKTRFHCIMDRYNERIPVDNDSNANCLIVGELFGPPLKPRAMFMGPFSFLFTVLLGLIFDYLVKQGFTPEELLILLAPFLLPSIYLSVIPFCIGRIIYFLDDEVQGKVISYGSNGLVSWEGNLIGKIKLLDWVNIGIIGFTGLALQVYFYDTYFIGFARNVHIEAS